MELLVKQVTVNGDTYGDRDGLSKTKPPHELDMLVQPEDILHLAALDTDNARREEIENIKNRVYYEKQALNRDIELLKGDLRQMENTLLRVGSVAERVDAEKRKATTSRELKTREQSLFLDGIRLDVEAENAIKRLIKEADLTAKVKRQFAIEIRGI